MKKGFIQEFKEFISQGNVMNLAIGVIIGGAFTAIVASLNKDIIGPILGIFGGTDFSHLKIALGAGKNAPVLTYGNFITAVINFLITAFIIFLLVKGVTKVQNKKKVEEEEVAPETKECPYCISEIAVEAVKCPHCTSSLS